jgi:predicted CopG family antitoxin
MMTTNCPVCGTIVEEYKKDRVHEPWFTCLSCGMYSMFYMTLEKLNDSSTEVGIKQKLSSKIYYHNLYNHKPYFIDYYDLEKLKTETTSPAQIINRLVEFLYKDQKLTSFNVDYYKLRPIIESFEPQEMDNYIDELERQKLIGKISGKQYKRTLKGFEVYEELKKGKSKSNQVFMALQFDSDAHKLYNTHFKPAVGALGLDLPIISDLTKAGAIIAQMEAQIRQSKFLIADVTPVENKPNANVYWEAGFARGLGKHVLYLCEESKVGELPFDTRGELHVLYDSSSDKGIAKAIDELQAKIFNTFPNELVLPENRVPQ